MDLGLDENLPWKTRTNTNELIHKLITSIIVDVETIDLDTVSSSELLMLWIDLDSHDDIVLAWDNVQLVTETHRTVEVIPVMSDYESTHYVSIVDTTIRIDDEHAR